jgi:hypothetical protein
MKILKWILIILAAIILLLFAAFKTMQWQTKKASPEDLIALSSNGLELEVFYNRPSKRDRVIFGGLVPYGKVWRTGANEATTFSTNKDLVIKGQTLKAGKYTLWTIPEKDSWTVIFNNKMYSWGVDFNAVASRNPEFDALKVVIPVEQLTTPVEQFTITLQNSVQLAMVLTWDTTRIVVPLEPA